MADRVTKNTLASNYQEIYANNCLMRISNWDFLFQFGKLGNITETELSVTSEIGVYLSPQQTKALMKVLIDNVSQYEKQFGEIVIEPKQGK